MKYSPEQLDALNNASLAQGPAELKAFFKKFRLPGNDHVYPNRFNCVFHAETAHEVRKPLFKKPEAFTDEKIVMDLRKILAKVSEQNKTTLRKQLLTIQPSETCGAAIADLFYQIAIDCVFLVDIYVPIYYQYSQETQHPEIMDRFLELVRQEYREPRQFEDTDCETGEHRRRRWYLNNWLVICQLYCLKRLDAEQLLQEFLLPTMSLAKERDDLRIEAVCKTLAVLGSEPSFYRAIADDLSQLSQDKELPSRLRFMVQDAIDGALGPSKGGPKAASAKAPSKPMGKAW